LKSEINYSVLLESIDTDKKDKQNGINDIINLDVARTFFDYDAEKSRKVKL
jgi:hypothetical protein